MSTSPLREVTELLRETFQEWSRDNCLRLGAALAYYTIFSIAPLLVIVIAIAALAFGRQAAEGEIIQQVESVLGAPGAETLRGMIERASRPSAGILAAAGGLATMVIGASSVFAQLQSALNEIWNVPPRPRRGVLVMLKERLTSFSIILVIGFLLLVSLVLSAAVSALHAYVGGLFPGAALALELLNFAVSFGVVTLLFAMIFKILPDADIRWGDVWIGAAFTAFLFAVGKLAIGLYLGNTSAGSVYGAASSLVIILLWVYYSSQLLFFGAEFTQVYARRYRSGAPAEAPGGGAGG
jgi:membrane protein